MARPIKPVSVNKKHLTKSEKEFREENKIQISSGELEIPDFIRNNSSALKKFKELKKYYKESENEYATISDSGFVGRYCLEFAIIIRLQFMRDTQINDNHLELAMQTDKLIDKKNILLMKMENELFLTPLSKVKTLPKREKKEVDTDSHLFGD